MDKILRIARQLDPIRYDALVEYGKQLLASQSIPSLARELADRGLLHTEDAVWGGKEPKPET